MRNAFFIRVAMLLVSQLCMARHYTDLPFKNPLYKPYAQDARLENSSTMVNGERHIVIVSPSYNNRSCVTRYLDSIANQRYSNFHLVYVDDCSTDGTAEYLRQYAREKGFSDRLILLSNSERRKALANLYFAIHLCKDTDIILIVDGDDHFATPEVLSLINKTYSDPNVWLTYGQFREYPSGAKGFCVDYDSEVIEKNSFRYFRRTASHLRTFYAGLFKKINVDDLLFRREFFSMCYDNAIMFPMLEMAGSHYKFIDTVLLEYNTENPLNDHKVSKDQQIQYDAIIRARTCYRPLNMLW